MTTLTEAWETLTGPRVEDWWVELIDYIPAGINVLDAESASFEGGTVGGWHPAGDVPPTLSVSGDGATDGHRAMLVTWGEGGTSMAAQILLPSVQGQTYSASMDVTVPLYHPPVALMVDIGRVIGADSARTDVTQRISVTWTATGSTSLLQLWARATPTAGQAVRVDSVMVNLGERPAGWAAGETPGGVLDGVTGCSVEQNIHAVVRGGATLSLRDVEQSLDWARIRFRPWVRANDLTWPLGVFLPASPRMSRDEHGTAWEVPCLDKTSILDQQVVTTTHTVPAGTVVTYAVAELIRGSGESAGALTPSPLTTRSAMTWEPGTTKLRIINDLLSSINYFSLWADRHGQYRAEPYRRPQDRALAAAFVEGEDAIHSATWSRELDIAGIPNRTVLIVDGDGENLGMTATADNTDVHSPYSIPNRGRVVDRVYENVEAADQSTLDALAHRYLAEASTPSATLDVAHASVPLDPNAVVKFTSGPVDTLAVVEGYRLNLEAGALMSGAWREVVS